MLDAGYWILDAGYRILDTGLAFASLVFPVWSYSTPEPDDNL